jgi:hypothetical protein
MSSQDEIQEPIWKFVKTAKPLRLFVQIFMVLSFLVGAWTITKPAFEYATNKFNYIFAIKPEDKLLKQDKYSFWAGFTLFESIHPFSNTDDHLASYFSNRQKLLKSFEVLGFDGKGASSITEIKTYSFIDRMTKNHELRDRLEGFLENRSNGNLELYRAGFALALLLTELQSPSVDKSKVQYHVQQFSLNWAKAQDAVKYRLPEVEIYYSDDEYFIYSQPNLMKKSVNTLKVTKQFYGQI